MADSPQSFLEVIGNTVGSGLKQAGSAVQRNQQNKGANALMMFKLLQEQHDQQLQHQESKLRMDHLRIEIAKSNNELALSTKKLADQPKEGLKIGGLSYADFAPVPLGLDAPENKLPDLGPILAEAGIPLPKNANEGARFGKIVAEHLGPLVASAGAGIGPLDMKALGHKLRESVDAADAAEEQHKIALKAKEDAGATFTQQELWDRYQTFLHGKQTDYEQAQRAYDQELVRFNTAEARAAKDPTYTNPYQEPKLPLRPPELSSYESDPQTSFLSWGQQQSNMLGEVGGKVRGVEPSSPVDRSGKSSTPKQETRKKKTFKDGSFLWINPDGSYSKE